MTAMKTRPTTIYCKIPTGTKEKRKKGNKMDGSNRCMGKSGDFRATFYF